MATLNELQRQRNNVLADASALLARGMKSAESKRSFESLLSQADRLEKDISFIERAERLGATQAAPAGNESPEVRRAKLNAAFRDAVQHGENHTRKEQRDLDTSSAGAVIPQEFSDTIFQAAKNFAPITDMVSVYDEKKATAGRPVKLPVSSDVNATMTYLGETSSTSGVEADPQLFSQLPSGTDTLVSTVLFSRQFASDVVDDFGSFLADIASLRVGRATEYALLTGKDNGSNTDLPNTASLLSGLPVVVTLSTGTLSTVPTYRTMSSLAASTDYAYRVNGSFLVNDTTFNGLVAQVDSTGRPLYKFAHDGPNAGKLIVAGRPVEVASSALAPYDTASSVIGAFGDWSKSYALVRSSMSIKFLTQRFAELNIIAAVISCRIAGMTLVQGSTNSLVSAAS